MKTPQWNEDALDAEGVPGTPEELLTEALRHTVRAIEELRGRVYALECIVRLSALMMAKRNDPESQQKASLFREALEAGLQSLPNDGKRPDFQSAFEKTIMSVHDELDDAKGP